MTDAIATTVLRAGLALVILGFALIVACQPARAHDWYPALCCSGRDCHPTGEVDGAREPAARFTPRGWVLHDGKVIPHDKVRQSPDGALHVCRRGGDPTGDVIEVDGSPCVFVPGLGF